MSEEKSVVPIDEEINVANFEENNIKNLIYTIRGKQVMLDSDVAMLYQCETKYVNRVVKRNIERFPEEFCFQLTNEEYDSLRIQASLTMRCQFVTAYIEKRNKSKIPYVFTEQGIAMLSALLKSDIAVKVSVNIMKAFIEMRKFIYLNDQVFERLTTLEYKQLETDKSIKQLFNMFEQEESIKQKIFFQGQIWDSYELIIDIIKKAKEKITIIDNYIDDSILKMLSKKNKNVKAVIITSEKSNLLKLDIQKFNKEYPTLEIAKTDKIHDRFIIIDNKELYHIGASLKDLGKKCFAISQIEDIEYIEKLNNLT